MKEMEDMMDSAVSENMVCMSGKVELTRLTLDIIDKKF